MKSAGRIENDEESVLKKKVFPHILLTFWPRFCLSPKAVSFIALRA